MRKVYGKILTRFQTVSLYGLGKSIAPISQLLVSYMIIKYHAVALWGSYVELLLWVNLIAVFTYFGNKNYLLKKFSENPSQVYQNWNAHFLSRLVLLAFALFLVFTLPVFQDFSLLVALWAFILFFNQSFEVLILYHRHFKMALFIDFFANALLLLLVFFYPGAISLDILLFLVLVHSFFKGMLLSVFYFRKFKNWNFKLSLGELAYALPFFIPMLLGTIRTRVDAYYGTLFFSKTDLSQYQIFISMLGLIQMGVSYLINPFLKNFYRTKDTVLRKIEKQFIWAGILTALFSIPMVYLLIKYLYGFDFSMLHYTYAFLFVSTLFLHLILINNFYKRNMQFTVARSIFIVAILQIVAGYFLIKNYNIDGALIIRVLGQLAIVVVLYVWQSRWIKKQIVN